MRLTYIITRPSFENYNLRMNQQERIEHHMEVERYLEKKNLYQIMQELVEGLLVEQPADPLAHMIAQLSKPESSVTLLVGPPGLHLYKIAEETLTQHGKKDYAAFNSGEFVASVKGSLSAEAQTLFKSSRLIPDELVGEKILGQVVGFCKKNPYAIVEGFPKTLNQAISLHKKGCIPDKVIFVNVNDETFERICRKKILQSCPQLNEKQLNEKVTLSANQYRMNSRDLKGFYPYYLQIDTSRSDNIGKQIQKCLNLHFGKVQPRKNTRIAIVGSPNSGRTTLGKKIAARYNLIYVSTAVLISEQIRRETVIGRKLNEDYKSNRMIDNFTVQKLIEERISKIDCQMQGFVLEGYPKNKEQLDNLISLHVSLDFLIAINAPAQVVKSRGSGKGNEATLNERIRRWQEFAKDLSSLQDIFWIDPNASTQNAFEVACFQIQNRKK